MCPPVGLYVAFTFLNKVIDMKEFCGWRQQPQRTPSLKSAKGKHMEPSKECGNKNWNIWRSLPSPLYFSGIIVSRRRGRKAALCRQQAFTVICCPLAGGASQRIFQEIAFFFSSDLSVQLPKIFQIKSKDNYLFSRLNLIAKTPPEDWMWYLTFIWATLGITSGFILQSVTLQWAPCPTELSRGAGFHPHSPRSSSPGGQARDST